MAKRIQSEKKTVPRGAKTVLVVEKKIISLYRAQIPSVANNINQSFRQLDCRQYCDDASSDSDDYTLLLESIDSVNIKSSPKKLFGTTLLNNTPVKFELDCGATVNSMPVDIYQKIFHDPQNDWNKASQP